MNNNKKTTKLNRTPVRVHWQILVVLIIRHNNNNEINDNDLQRERKIPHNNAPPWICIRSAAAG